LMAAQCIEHDLSDEQLTNPNTANSATRAIGGTKLDDIATGFEKGLAAKKQKRQQSILDKFAEEDPLQEII
jgi:hypothetical protein